MASNVAIEQNQLRRELAKEIRSLTKSIALNAIAMGNKLKAARDTFSDSENSRVIFRRGWSNWVKKEAGLNMVTANKLIRVANRFSAKDTLPALVGTQILVLLAKDHTPKEAVSEITRRAAIGEKITAKKAARIIHHHTLPLNLPAPVEANRLAKETGKAQMASNGYWYFGTSPKDAKAGEDRRAIVYGVKRAIATLSEMDMTPDNFIMYALPHQLWNEEEEAELERAMVWLTKLCEAWRTHR